MTTNFFHPSVLLLILDPGSGMGKNQDPGSGINIPDPQHCNFPYIYKEIQKGAVAKSYMTNGSPYPGLKNWFISSYIRKPFLLFDFTTAPF
jgi:hypothetical protein